MHLLKLSMVAGVWLALAGCGIARNQESPKTEKITTISLQRFDGVKEVKYPWGWIRWMMNAELDPAAEQTFGLVEINPHQSNPLHMHPNCEELLYVVSGTFENVIGDKNVTLRAGDVLRIPKGVPHRGINNSDEPMRAVISYSSGSRQMAPLGKDKE